MSWFKILSRLSIGIWFFLLWCYKMLLSSDIPVSISYDHLKNTLLVLIISIVLTLLFIQIVVDTKLVYFIATPAVLWGISMTQAILHHYHKYDTILSIVGFVGCAIIALFSIYKTYSVNHTRTSS